MEEEAEIVNGGRQISACRSRSSGGRGTSIHITALDGIVNVNSLFTLGVFIGLAWNPTDPTVAPTASCSAGAHYVESMVSFHVFSFSCFLFSSLVALCLKQLTRAGARINRALLTAGILLSAAGSVCACGFLMLAMVNVVQIKLGRLGCGGVPIWAAFVPLVTLIPIGILIYSAIIVSAFCHKIDKPV